MTPVIVDTATGDYTTTRCFLYDDPTTGTAADEFTVVVSITDDDSKGSIRRVAARLPDIMWFLAITAFESDATFDALGNEGDSVNIMATFTDVPNSGCPHRHGRSG